MFVHEYQAKSLLSRYGFSFPAGEVVNSADEAGAAANRINADYWVVKAQILAGDRGRFGGVKVARSQSEVSTLARTLLGSRLVTPQTGAAGLPVRSVYVEQGCEADREMYLALLLDRYQRELILLASASGGSGIETALDDSSQSLHRVAVPVNAPPDQNELADLAQKINLEGSLASDFMDICAKMYQAVIELDAISIELNPLAVVGNDRLVCLDVKMELDDNAIFRHNEFSEIVDLNQETDRRNRTQSGYNYVRLNGNIGLLVGGAGLALATMDLLKLHGLDPANFLDLPPIASRSDVSDACQTVMQDESIKALFVNVVGGGLTHCDTAAEGLITANEKSRIKKPIVVRFAGTKKEHGITLLRNSRIPIQMAGTMNEAIQLLLRIR